MKGEVQKARGAWKQQLDCRACSVAMPQHVPTTKKYNTKIVSKYMCQSQARHLMPTQPTPTPKPKPPIFLVLWLFIYLVLWIRSTRPACKRLVRKLVGWCKINLKDCSQQLNNYVLKNDFFNFYFQLSWRNKLIEETIFQSLQITGGR